MGIFTSTELLAFLYETNFDEVVNQHYHLFLLYLEVSPLRTLKSTDTQQILSGAYKRKNRME